MVPKVAHILTPDTYENVTLHGWRGFTGVRLSQ